MSTIDYNTTIRTFILYSSEVDSLAGNTAGYTSIFAEITKNCCENNTFKQEYNIEDILVKDCKPYLKIPGDYFFVDKDFIKDGIYELKITYKKVDDTEVVDNIWIFSDTEIIQKLSDRLKSFNIETVSLKENTEWTNLLLCHWALKKCSINLENLDSACKLYRQILEILYDSKYSECKNCQ